MVDKQESSLHKWIIEDSSDTRSVSKKDAFGYLLRNLEISVKGMKGIAAITKDGLPISTRLPRDVDVMAFSGMSAAMFCAAETTIKELRDDCVYWVYTETDEFTLVVVDAGFSTLLVALISAGANIGLVLVKLKAATGEIKALMD